MPRRLQLWLVNGVCQAVTLPDAGGLRRFWYTQTLFEDASHE